jgi:hypothetical protein
MITPEYTFILRLQTDKLVHWTGTTGADAARRYIACHPDSVVEAYVQDDRTGFFPGVSVSAIREPGEVRPGDTGRVV